MEQMAILSGRVPVWPDFACNSPWLEDEGEREKRKGDEGEGWFGATWRTDLEIVPRQPIDALPSQRRCLVWHYYEADCDAHVSFCPLSAPFQLSLSAGNHWRVWSPSAATCL